MRHHLHRPMLAMAAMLLIANMRAAAAEPHPPGPVLSEPHLVPELGHADGFTASFPAALAALTVQLSVYQKGSLPEPNTAPPPTGDALEPGFTPPSECLTRYGGAPPEAGRRRRPLSDTYSHLASYPVPAHEQRLH